MTTAIMLRHRSRTSRFGIRRHKPRARWSTRSRLTRLRPLSVLIAVVLSTQNPVLAQTDPNPFNVGSVVQGRFDQIASQLVADRSGPLGLVALEELRRFARWFPSAMAIPLLESLFAADETNEWVRAAAGWDLIQAHLAAGDLDASTAAVAEQGYLVNWSIAGPFPNEGMAGYDTAYAPEESRGPQQVFFTRLGSDHWHDVTGLVRGAYVDLDLLSPPAHSSVVYAHTAITAPRRVPARLWSAVDGSYKIWLNGTLVAAVQDDLGGGFGAREYWDIELTRGDNVLIIKTAAEESSLGFALRLTNRSGSALAGLVSTAEITDDVSVLALATDTVDVGTPTASVLSILSALFFDHVVDLGVSRSEGFAGAALVIATSYPDDPAEPYRQFLATGDACDSGFGAESTTDEHRAVGGLTTPRSLRLCAAVLDQYWRRYQAAADAVALIDLDGSATDDERLWTRYELAAILYQAVGTSALEQVRDLVQPILQTRPDFVPALLLAARVNDQDGQTWAAYRRRIDALTLAPDSPEVLYQAQWSYRRVGDTPALIDIYRRRAALSANSVSPYLSLVPALAMAGELDEALEALEAAILMNPLSLGLRWLKADLLLSADDHVSARAVLEETVQMLPGSAMAWEHLGRFYVQIGADDEAGPAFGHALAIEPQNQELASYQSQLSATQDDFYAEYVLSLDDIEALAWSDDDVAGRDYYTLLNQEVVRVYNNGLASRFYQESYQIQTRSGANALREFYIQYTPGDQVVEVLSARIVKADGTVQESVSRWEQSLSQPWYNIYYDLRAVVLGFEDLAPGDRLEVSYTVSDVSTENMFDDYFGEFLFVQDNQPQSMVRFVIIHPDELTLNYRYPVLEHELETETDAQRTREIITLRDVPRIDSEPSMPGYSSVADHLHVSTFSDWEDVSAWYWNLIGDQLVASPEIEATVAELVEGLTDTEDRVRAIHEYVVRNTRYVGLEFGIHGFRPYRSAVVFSRRFGDCKDTASLMKVMLGVAGIDAYIVLVRTRDRGNIEEYPPSLAVFNHAITYVPELDLFMDGTAGHSGLGELPWADQGASALVVFDGGDHSFGSIAYQPASDNQMIFTVDVDLGEEGQPARARVEATGQFAPSLRVRYESEESRLEDFQLQFRQRYSGAQLTDVRFEGLEDITVPVTIEVAFTNATWSRATGTGLQMLPLGSESSLSRQMAATATRRQILEIPHPFVEVHELTYRLPEGATVTGGERDISGETPFGSFAVVVRRDGQTIRVSSRLELTQTRISPDDYPEFREFIQSAEEAMNQSIQVSLSGATDG